MTTGIQKHTAENLQRLVGQIERLEEERKGLGEDIKDKMNECRSIGLDVRIIKKILQLRKKSKIERDEDEQILHVYMNALGMLGDEGTPLAQWADRGATAHA